MPAQDVEPPHVRPAAIESSVSLGRLREALAGPFELSVERPQEPRLYHMQTEFIHLGFDGKRLGLETYLLRLSSRPPAGSGKQLDEYACREFGLQLNEGALTTLPALHDFTYEFDALSGVLTKGPFFGIPQGPFAGLKDSTGSVLPPDISYAVYNNFVDFHALSDVFSRPMKYVKGVEQLTRMGDRIVHPGAYTEAPVSLDGVVRPGSIFRNGELSLELKGLSLVDNQPCALVNYDSGESTLKMAFVQSGKGDIRMEGGSEYTGDIYIDLSSGCVRKVTLNEAVVTRTRQESESTWTPGYTARHILLRWMDRKTFEQPITRLT